MNTLYVKDKYSHWTPTNISIAGSFFSQQSFHNLTDAALTPNLQQTAAARLP